MTMSFSVLCGPWGNDLGFLFDSENFGFCTLIKAFLRCISKATELKKD